MPPGPLRRALEDFIATSPPAVKVKSFWDQFNNRADELAVLYNSIAPLNNVREWIWFTYFLGFGCLYLITGFHPAYDILYQMLHPPTVAQVKETVQETIEKVFSDPVLGEWVEVMGSLVTDPVMDLFEEFANHEEKDPRDFARRFHGLMTAITTTGTLADFVAQATSLGQIKAIGTMVQSVYWNLGLGFLGWQTMAPILSAGLQPGLTRHYNKLYRPMRFSASELRDLYALGEITADQLRDGARSMGWRDEDIEQWIQLAFRTMSAGDIWQAYHEGKRNTTWVTERLRALGYDPADIPLMIELNPVPPENEIKELSASTARRSYREDLISAAQLRSYLQLLDYSEAEITLITSLEDLSKEDAAKRLTVGQVKEAWTANVLTDSEAKHWLREAGFPSQQIEILLSTWKQEVTPVFVKVNLGTVLGAYVTHIYNRVQTYDKLATIGFSPEDATLELDLAELRNPDAFQPPAPPPPKLLTPGVLAELVFYGLMTPQQMHDRLVALAYTDPDATLLTEAARIRARQAPKPLPQATIANAYRAGVISRDQAGGLLSALGYTAENAALILDTLEARYPEDFGAAPEVRMKVLHEATLVDLTVAGVITTAELRARLAALLYEPGDIELILVRVEQLMAPPVRILTQTTVERGYIALVLTREAAYAKLIEIFFTPEDANQILNTVEIENPAVFNPALVQVVRLPSISALVMAVQNGLLTEEQYLARCQEIGYRPEDAQLYLALATKNERKATTRLTPAQIVAAYNKGFYSYGAALGLLAQRGYSDADGIILLRTSKDLIENTDAWYGMLQGDLTFSDVLTQLVNFNYADEDILKAFSSLPVATRSSLGVDLTDLGDFLKTFPGGE